jgi:CspA family cold shock protein
MVLVGRVSWFDPKKGYGFILDKDDKQYFVHYSSVQMDGYRTLEENSEVEFESWEGPRGPYAANVKVIG